MLGRVLSFVFLLIAIEHPSLVLAQSSIVVDVVTLKDSAAVKGTILSNEKKKPLKIRTTEGQTMSIKRARIKAISKETLVLAPPEVAKPVDTAKAIKREEPDPPTPPASSWSGPVSQQIKVGPVTSIPMGDFATGSHPGVGLIAEYDRSVANDFYIVGRLGYVYWFGKDFKLPSEALYINVSSIILGAGARYSLTSNFSLYGLLSLHLFSSSGKIAIRRSSGVTDTTALSGSKTEFGFTPGAEYDFDFRLFGSLRPGISAELNIIPDGFTNVVFGVMLSTNF